MTKKLSLGVALALASLALAVFVANWAAGALDAYGISYYAEVSRYLQAAIGESPQHHTEGETGRIFQNEPNVHHENRRFVFATDQYGFRRPADWDYDRNEAGRLRVLFLGDSVTLGWGVDDEDTWVRAIERRALAADGRELRCLNSGHLMFDTVQQASLLKAWGPEHSPDVVVLTFVFNDLHPTWGQFIALSTQTSDPSLADNEPNWLATRLEAVAPNLGKVLRFKREARLYAQADKSKLAPYSFYPDGWGRCAEALDRIAQQCSELGARLVVMDQTTQQDMPELIAWCASNGVAYIDTCWSEEETSRDVRNSPVDAHANALGNEYIANRALSGLVELEIVRER